MSDKRQELNVEPGFPAGMPMRVPSPLKLTEVAPVAFTVTKFVATIVSTLMLKIAPVVAWNVLV